MSSMSGNPHASPLPAGDARTQVTLALAFEQRTANLIALAALHAANGRRELGEPFIAEAVERLGMSNERSEQ